jgi:hypothetical protein
MLSWDIITGEYPPQFGGVSDYTYLLAHGLRDAGDEVDVWAPKCGNADSAGHRDEGVVVHRLPGCFGPRALVELDRELRRRGKFRQMLVQYVPQMYGWRAMNVGFCTWLRWRRDLQPWVMFHEVAMPLIAGQPWRHRMLAGVTRKMATLVAQAAERVLVSIPNWEILLHQLGAAPRPTTWLQVPSNMPTNPIPASFV